MSRDHHKTTCPRFGLGAELNFSAVQCSCGLLAKRRERTARIRTHKAAKETEWPVHLGEAIQRFIEARTTKRRTRWFARMNGVTQMGPFDSYERAANALMTVDGDPAPGAFVWPNTIVEEP